MTSVNTTPLYFKNRIISSSVDATWYLEYGKSASQKEPLRYLLSKSKRVFVFVSRVYLMCLCLSCVCVCLCVCVGVCDDRGVRPGVLCAGLGGGLLLQIPGMAGTPPLRQEALLRHRSEVIRLTHTIGYRLSWPELPGIRDILSQWDLPG